MATVATAVAIMSGLGVLFAAVLAGAQKLFRVEEDPRLEALTDLLPGSNCGACGAPGCAGFAEELIAGKLSPGACTVTDAETLEEVAAILGVEVGAADKRVARLKCAGGNDSVRTNATYEGIESCRAAVLVDGGGRACPYGCLGLGDCKVSCGFDAIQMSEEGLPVVEPEACTACGDCVEACPLDLFVIEPLSRKLFVQCSSPITGDAAREQCRVACDACGRCAADAPDLIKMKDGLPVIHWERDLEAEPRATWRCPTGAIVWKEEGE